MGALCRLRERTVFAPPAAEYNRDATHKFIAQFTRNSRG